MPVVRRHAGARAVAGSHVIADNTSTTRAPRRERQPDSLAPMAEADCRATHGPSDVLA